MDRVTQSKIERLEAEVQTLRNERDVALWRAWRAGNAVRKLASDSVDEETAAILRDLSASDEMFRREFVPVDEACDVEDELNALTSHVGESAPVTWALGDPKDEQLVEHAKQWERNALVYIERHTRRRAMMERTTRADALWDASKTLNAIADEASGDERKGLRSAASLLSQWAEDASRSNRPSNT